MNINIKEKLNISNSGGKLKFSFKDIKLDNSSFSAVISEGELEKVKTLFLNNNVTEQAISDINFLGPVTYYKYICNYENGYTLTWSLGILENEKGFLLNSSFYNGSHDPVRLKEFKLLEPLKPNKENLHCTEDPKDWCLSTLGYSDRIGSLDAKLKSVNEETIERWKGYGLPIPNELSNDEKSTDGRWRTFIDCITLYKEKEGFVAAAVGEAVCDVNFNCRVDNGDILLDISADMNNVIVEAGQTRTSQEVVFLFDNYDNSIEKVFRWWALSLGSRVHRGPITGWCSWYDSGQYITEEIIENVADTFKSLKDRVKLDVIQIDDGFQKHIGDWSCNEQFPQGWENIVNKIEESGAIPGIWLAPLAVHDSLGILENNPDWFQRDKNGNLLGKAGNWGEPGHWLDPTHPCVQEFIRNIIRQQIKEGFRYFKIDFNTISGGCHFYNPYKTRLQAMRDLYKLYRDEVGEDSYLLSCSGFTRGTMGYADASRIGPDATPVWKALHPCTISQTLRAVGMSAIANGIIYANDPDVTYVKRRNEIFDPIDGSWTQMGAQTALTNEEWQTWHSMVGLLGGLAMVSEPRYKEEYIERIRSLEILMPQALEKGRSFYAATDFNHTRFGYAVKRNYGIYACVMLWNDKDEPSSLNINPSDIDSLKCLGNKFHVWSFWDEKYLGIFDEVIQVDNIPPHGCVVLRITPFKEETTLIGNNLHISMGAADIKDIIVTNNNDMKIYLNDSGAKDGSIYIYSERGFEVNKEYGLKVHRIEHIGNGIWKVTIIDRVKEHEQFIKFNN